MRPEQRLTNWFVSHAPAEWHVVRIENVLGRGIPDLNICTEGVEFWVECKADSAGFYVRPEQWAWMSRRIASGGHCFVLLRRDIEWKFCSVGECAGELAGDRICLVPARTYTGRTFPELLVQLNQLIAPWKPK